LYIAVLSNTYPDFETELQTSWIIPVDGLAIYKLPKLIDAEGNDEPVVYIDYMKGFEDYYPPFIGWTNETRTLVFKPLDTGFSGKQYFFTITVKEQNSDVNQYTYYCDVQIEVWIDPDFQDDTDDDKDEEPKEILDEILDKSRLTDLDYLEQYYENRATNIFSGCDIIFL
jgi:hypothetical protein